MKRILISNELRVFSVNFLKRKFSKHSGLTEGSYDIKKLYPLRLTEDKCDLYFEYPDSMTEEEAKKVMDFVTLKVGKVKNKDKSSKTKDLETRLTALENFVSDLAESSNRIGGALRREQEDLSQLGKNVVDHWQGMQAIMARVLDLSETVKVLSNEKDDMLLSSSKLQQPINTMTQTAGYVSSEDFWRGKKNQPRRPSEGIDISELSSMKEKMLFTLTNELDCCFEKQKEARLVKPVTLFTNKKHQGVYHHGNFTILQTEKEFLFYYSGHGGDKQ